MGASARDVEGVTDFVASRFPKNMIESLPVSNEAVTAKSNVIQDLSQLLSSCAWSQTITLIDGYESLFVQHHFGEE